MTKKTIAPASPWDEVDESGTGLTVNNFLTTRLSKLTNSLRRTVTTPYAQAYDLSVSEWRLLSLIAHAKTLPFGELVVQSTSDKALVSRTLRLLEGRGLVRITPEDELSGKRLLCHITAKGEALHEKVIPIARARQAQTLRLLKPAQRKELFQALQTLQQFLDIEEARTSKKPIKRQP
jgi:DNA-binding MarR family transcriptional regulator